MIFEDLLAVIRYEIVELQADARALIGLIDAYAIALSSREDFSVETIACRRSIAMEYAKSIADGCDQGDARERAFVGVSRQFESRSDS